MRPITSDDIRTLSDYEAVRDDLRARIIALKKHRRVLLGNRLSLVFENRETVLWQIHEMCRAEKIEQREAVAQECEVYSRLLPEPAALSATLFIEIDDQQNIRPWLDALRGIDAHLALVLGGERLPGAFDPSQYSSERISAVHYVRFPLTPAQRQHFVDLGVPAKLVVDHPVYAAEAVLTGETRRSLAADLES